MKNLDWTYQINELDAMIENSQRAHDDCIRRATDQINEARRLKKRIKAFRKQRKILADLQVTGKKNG